MCLKVLTLIVLLIINCQLLIVVVMLSFPNAKINLGLNIVEKREDGFHNIETIFYPIGVKDALEFVESKTSSTNMQISNIQVDCDPASNLVMKAYELLKQDFQLPHLSICLQKNIPFGAGLGGGSSDAAFMLKMLNEHFSLGLSNCKLEEYASNLGSDCPFFINNMPVFAKGRGEVFESLDLSLRGKYLALIKPNVFVSTKQAYANCIPSKPSKCLKKIVQLPMDSWREHMVNDFELSVFAQFPEIAAVKELLYKSGAIYASMSGSGSSVFGLFEEEPVLKNLFPESYCWIGSF